VEADQDRCTDLYIIGAAQLASGVHALLAECLAEGDGCFSRGEIRVLPLQASAVGWTKMTRTRAIFETQR
jgi:hypothetical protein